MCFWWKVAASLCLHTNLVKNDLTEPTLLEMDVYRATVQVAVLAILIRATLR
jgi:hypothetical protein